MSTKSVSHCHLIVGLDIGGTEKSLLKTLPRLQSTNSSHIVINLSHPGPIGDMLRITGIQVHDLNIIHPVRFPLGIITLYRLLKKIHPNSLTTYFIYSDLLGRLVGRLAGIKRIYCYQRGALLAAGLLRPLDFVTQSLVTKYLFVSQALNDRVSRSLLLPATKTQTITNGVTPPPLPYRRQHSHTIISHVGSFKPKKGQEYLLRSLPSLDNLDYQVRFIGSGPLLAKTKSLSHTLKLSRHVSFIGQVSDVSAYYPDTDIFVLTSLEEGMSNALLEAMSYGCAVIAHHSPENREVIGATGLLLDITNADLLSAKLRFLIAHPRTRRRLGRLARNRIQNHFHLDKTISSLRQLYQTV